MKEGGGYGSMMTAKCKINETELTAANPYYNSTS